MKAVPSIGDGVLYINGWGWPENQPGRQIALASFEDTLKTNDADGDRALAPAEMPHERLNHPSYFQTFDTSRDGRLNLSEWNVTRAMMAAENGLLAIRLDGDPSSAIRWRYQRPVPQVPSTLLYRGVLFMVNDSGILISFDPATGQVHKQGRLEGAIDKYFASPIGAGRRVWLISQDGTVSVVDARAQWRVEQVNPLGDEVFATPAAAGGRLYVRTRSLLYCFARREGTMPRGKTGH
jgi:outer membrane protein assembly factor BamB